LIDERNRRNFAPIVPLIVGNIGIFSRFAGFCVAPGFVECGLRELNFYNSCSSEKAGRTKK
jgi:hypothetical protein